MPKKFYVTTPIYYPSGNLHIGHAYTTTIADILKRYKKLDGYETYFLTGSDEHGQKIEQKAQEAHLSPLDYLDDKVQNFKDLWRLLAIDYDQFIRTTATFHTTTVQQIFSKLLNDGHIYPGKYEGVYCVSCEEFLNQNQITADNRCKISGNTLEVVQEDTYFFKLSSFQEFIEHDVLAGHYLIPAYRRNEMLNSFVKPELKDLSVTRTSFNWGISVKENPQHVVYVWIDALTNYITALGYLQKDDQRFKHFWLDEKTEILHLAGKEIIRFHSIYWPVILKALKLRQPTHLLGHGWILSKGDKMSKSIGNVINPIDIIHQYGADALRFYIACELPTEKDGNFTEELFVEAYNAHLANNIGNLISRTNQMIVKYFDGYIDQIDLSIDNELNRQWGTTQTAYERFMNQYKISEAIKQVLNFANICNKYIEEQMPWVLAANQEEEQLKKVLYSLQVSIAKIIFLLQPVLVESTQVMFENIGLDLAVVDTRLFKNLNYLKFIKIKNKSIIFNRIKQK